MIHGLPMPFITVDGHYEVGTKLNWNDETEYEIYQCDPIGDNPETQLQNCYVKPVETN